MSLIVLLGAAYGVVCILVYAAQERLLFFPRANDPGASNRLLDSRWSTQRDGVTLSGWRISHPSGSNAPLVLYFGGNAQDVSLMAANDAHAANYLYVNYRGYGVSEGTASVSDLKADALHVYDAAVSELPHNGNVLAHGRSLGSGVAVHLAAHRPVAALILVTPYDSIRELARRYYPWLPVAALLRDDFDSAALAANLSQPALFLLAGRDTVIPAVHSQRLAEAWGGPIEILQLPDASHDGIGTSSRFRTRVAEFIGRF